MSSYIAGGKTSITERSSLVLLYGQSPFVARWSKPLNSKYA